MKLVVIQLHNSVTPLFYGSPKHTQNTIGTQVSTQIGLIFYYQNKLVQPSQIGTNHDLNSELGQV